MKAQFFLTAWREHRGLTQERLGERIGVSGATVSRWETSEREPNFQALAALADALSCDVSELFSVNPQIDYSVDALLKKLGDMERAQAKKMINSLIEALQEQQALKGA